MFVNLGIQSSNWHKHQIQRANDLGGDVRDVSLPESSPHETTWETKINAKQFVDHVEPLRGDVIAVEFRGENHVFLYSVIEQCKLRGLRCVTPVYEDGAFFDYREWY